MDCLIYIMVKELSILTMHRTNAQLTEFSWV